MHYSVGWSSETLEPNYLHCNPSCLTLNRSLDVSVSWGVAWGGTEVSPSWVTGRTHWRRCGKHWPCWCVEHPPSAGLAVALFLLQLPPVLGVPPACGARLGPYPLHQRPCGAEMVLSVQLTNRSRGGGDPQDHTARLRGAGTEKKPT